MRGTAGRALGVARTVVLVLIAMALTITLTDTSGLVPTSAVDLASYYTFQVNIVFAPLLALQIWHQVRGTRGPRWLEYARAFVASNLVIVGLVYWALVFPLGTEHGWGMTTVMIISHIITPLYMAWEFAVVGPYGTMPWRAWWVVAVYPVVWTAATVVRSAEGTFVPYEHLDPARGWGALAWTLMGHIVLLAMITPVTLRLRRLRRLPDPALVGVARGVLPRDVNGRLAAEGRLPVSLLAGQQQRDDAPQA